VASDESKKHRPGSITRREADRGKEDAERERQKREPQPLADENDENEVEVTR
jgi:hypothetical protein